MDFSSSSSSLPLLSCLLQTTLRSLCTAGTDWVYAVFWRILPRNYPPPKWDTAESILDRSSGNKRNWILVWEDGYCDFSVCAKDFMNSAHSGNTSDSYYNQNHNANDNNDRGDNANRQWSFLQPELFFKMSHEVYNYGEGVMGKIAADNSHRWFFNNPDSNQNDILSPSSWQAVQDSQPRTWEAQFGSGIETIAVVAVKEGLLQLGSLRKVEEDLNFVIFVQRKFNYLQNISTYYAITCSSSSSSPTSTPPSFQLKDNNYYYNNQCPLVPRKTHKENLAITNNSQKVDDEDEQEQLAHFEPTTSSGYLRQIVTTGKTRPNFCENNRQSINPSRSVLADRDQSLPITPRLGMPLYPLQQQNSQEDLEAPYSTFWHDLMG